MKYGLLKYSESTNIGDQIQSLAAKQYLDTIDVYLDRDYLNEYKSDTPTKLIMNGWYMSKPENWPPSEDIIPFFISFHISHNNGSDQKIISKKHFEYFKKHEPIGCRDKKTLALFEAIGIDAYYSACLTLTLPKRDVEKNGKIILVDPFIKLPKDLRDKYIASLIPDEEKENVEILYQTRTDLQTSEERFSEAESYLDKYAKAKLVITSRIHCALPCLAMGTPVIFLDVGFTNKSERDRFNGIIDNMNVIDSSVFPYPNTTLKRNIYKLFKNTSSYNMVKKPHIDWKNPKANPKDITPLADKLRSAVQKFLANDQ